MKLFTVVLTILLNASICFAYDFSYSISDPSASTADEYIVSKSNVKIIDDGTFVYWKQDVGTALLEESEPGTIIYKFDFQKPIAQGNFFTRITTFHWSYSKGHSFIYASKDGIDWIKLAEATPPPDNGGYNIQYYNDALPSEFIGVQQVWIKIELNSYGTNASYGGAMTNTAQHLRYEKSKDNTTFRLEVDFDPEPIPPSPCQASVTILTNSNPNHTITSGCDEQVYGTSSFNQITLERGARAELFNFPGQNSIQIQSMSDLFTVSRSGTVVTFQGSDETILKIPATTDIQTISFNGEESRVLQIHNNQVVLDDQVIGTANDPISSSIEPIKGVFFNTEKESNWILTALDQNNLFYSFFGNKDANGSPQNFTELVLDKQNGDSFAPYLTIQFDESGRPVSVIMPDAEGKMILEYTSSAEVTVTVEANDGTRDSFVVDSPYDVQRVTTKSIIKGDNITESSSMEVSKSVKGRYQRASELDQRWSVGGTITGCNNNEVPNIQVKRELDAVILASAPQLALIKPTVETSEYLEDGQFSYYYYLQGLPDYDDWYWSCAWSYSGGLVTGLLGDTADKVLQLGESVIKDIKGDAGKNSVNFVIDNIGDAMLPSWSFLIKLYDMGKLPIDIHNGPCSEKVYDFLNQVQTASETVTVTLNGVTKIKSFDPIPEWVEHFWSVQAPDFDFSDSCDEKEVSWNPRYCPQFNPIDYFHSEILLSGVDSEGNAYDKIACNYFSGINAQLQYETPFTREGESPYIFEEKNGITWTWYEGGEFKGSTPYKAGRLHGIKKEYHPIGNLIKETPYEEGRIHGVMKEYYAYPSIYLNGNEKIQVETTYSYGEKDGETRYYDSKGVMTSCKIYESGTYSSIGSCMP